MNFRPDRQRCCQREHTQAEAVAAQASVWRGLDVERLAVVSTELCSITRTGALVSWNGIDMVCPIWLSVSSETKNDNLPSEACRGSFCFRQSAVWRTFHMQKAMRCSIWNRDSPKNVQTKVNEYHWQLLAERFALQILMCNCSCCVEYCVYVCAFLQRTRVVESVES